MRIYDTDLSLLGSLCRRLNAAVAHLEPYALCRSRVKPWTGVTAVQPEVMSSVCRCIGGAAAADMQTDVRCLLSLVCGLAVTCLPRITFKMLDIMSLLPADTCSYASYLGQLQWF
jgi:hypothetical protein